jgi:hypothetical protein
LVRLGDAEAAEQALADLNEDDSDRGEIRIAAAMMQRTRQPGRGVRRARVGPGRHRSAVPADLAG